MNARFCEVALPVPLRSTFTYAIPERFSGAEIVGGRVAVPFRNRAMVGVAVKLSANPAAAKATKEIVELVDDIPALTPQLLALGEWISGYYVAPIGETLRSMLPPLAELREQREYFLTEHGREFLAEAKERGMADPSEAEDLAALELIGLDEEAIFSAKLKRIVGGELAAQRLMRRGLIAARERMQRKKERVQRIVSWNSNAAPADEREEKVRKILTATRGPLPASALAQQGVSRALLARLEKQETIIVWEEPFTADEDPWEANFIPPANTLNAEQQCVMASIREWLAARKFTAALLHGVTGSGKTEVYLAAIEAALAQQRTAIVLVPEIALTLWLSRLVRARFGATVAVLHSGLADNERSHEWWRVRRGEARVVVGTRSAVFAPLENLGLLIVDEEQEGSYKQEETPRYHGRDVGVVRARLAGALALLGSATPSLESYWNAREGKYRLATLPERVEGRKLATVEIVDMRQEFRETHTQVPVSRRLREDIEAQLSNHRQTMILLNRRGYSWFVLCRSCGQTQRCVNCSISLTYHRREHRLMCHYCGYSALVPTRCPACESEHLHYVGEGTEKLEDKFAELFPGARVARLDRDIARRRGQFIKTLSDFRERKIDILVGTQLIAKGHDFPGVTLVGVVSVDAGLSIPDFRAAERTFQLLTQAAGRAGRGNLPGRVLVQTFY